MSQDFLHWRPHPWHGLPLSEPANDSIGPFDVVNAYIEITPFDLVKYEIDKNNGYLRVDRPHRTSSLPPTLYGFVPRTYCGERVKALMANAECGDGDPLDICVISERPIARSEVILSARVIGGLPMLDGGEADDKIIAVLANDEIWTGVSDIHELPEQMTARLRHYFSTYKTLPGEDPVVSVGPAYGRDHAVAVIAAAAADYAEAFPV